METTPEQAAEGVVVVRVLAAVLDRLVCANAPLAIADPGQVTKFHALKAPGIGILQYLERIHKYASCSNECFILALIYIDRLIQRNNFLLTDLNVHRVVITAILLAAKFFDDAYYNNAYYAKVGGVLVSEMNGLEVDFLFRINFSLHVTPELFHKYREELVSHSGGSVTSSQQDLIHPLPTPSVTRQSLRSSVAQPGTTHLTASLEASIDAGSVASQTSNYSAAVPKRHSNYVSPSPPVVPTKNALQLHGTEIIPSVHVDPQSAATEQLAPYLQRAKALQMPTFPMVQHRRCSPQPNYAAAAMVPIATADGSALIPDASEQYLLIENMAAYPLHHPTLIHHNHAMNVDVNVTGAMHPLAHGYQTRHQAAEQAYMNGNPMIACDAASSQYFMGGHMLAGCSRGG